MEEQDTFVKSAEMFAKALSEATQTIADTFTDGAESMRVALEELREVAEALQENEKAAEQAEIARQNTFTTWKEFLNMEPSRLQPTNTYTTKNIFTETPTTLEMVPEPKTTYAKKHKPGAVYQASAHEWYVESGTKADAHGGGGYMVTRAYVPERNELRWFCTCMAAKRAMYSDNPYCKHMYAVQEHIYNGADLFHRWVYYPQLIDVGRHFARLEALLGLSEQQQQYLDDLQETFPLLKDALRFARANEM